MTDYSNLFHSLILDKLLYSFIVHSYLKDKLMVIAIDGPAGAGKSSISSLLAERLQMMRLDTGALYRGIALAAIEANITAVAGDDLDTFLQGLSLDQHDGVLWVNQQDRSQDIRQPIVSQAASDFAVLASVRAYLLETQREIATRRDCIVDGRDIGTVVFPQAEVKIYLTASVAKRAERRWLELKSQGVDQDLSQVQAEIEARDYQDMNREIAPLKQASDAVLVDASDLSIEQVITWCYTLVQRVRT
jgi:CMP/dCMP kinase